MPDPGAQRIHAGQNRDARHRLRQGQPGPDSPDGIILVSLRIAEIREHAVAHVLRHEAAELGDRSGAGFMIGAEDWAVLFGIESVCEGCRSDEIAEHHRQLPPLRFCAGVGGMGWRAIEACNGVQELAAMADGMNAEFLQIVRGEPRQGVGIHGIVAEGLFILRQSKAS